MTVILPNVIICEGGQMKILLVEDDVKIAAFIIKGLKSQGFNVDHVEDGVSGVDLATVTPYDVIITDLMLPKKSGLSLIKDLREQKLDTPIIILSAKDTVDDRVKGLEYGADDYLTKPFAFSELLARLYALVRRSMTKVDITILTAGDLSMDLIKREVKRGDVKIELQPLEFNLLEYLVRNKGRVISKTMLMEHVWDYYFDPQSNVVEARVYKLREKVDKDFTYPLIHTIRGVGYTIKDKEYD